MKGDIKLRREVFNALNDYLDHLKSDYAKSNQNVNDEIRAHMIKDFADSLKVKKDKVYARVIVRGAVHSFVMISDFGRFKRGDILRALRKTKPDTDFSHGNVLDKKYEKISWSGV